jgi:hypothetical protein
LAERNNGDAGVQNFNGGEMIDFGENQNKDKAED